MGNFSRNKGAREELSVVHAFQEAGIGAEKIPLSGAVGGSFCGDVTVPVQGEDWRGECKVRADGFKQLYDWLGSNQFLTVRADRKPRLVILRQDDFIKLALGQNATPNAPSK